MPTHQTIDPIASAVARHDLATLQAIRNAHAKAASEHLINAVAAGEPDDGMSLFGKPVRPEEVLVAVRHAEEAARADAELNRLDAAYRRLLAAIFAPGVRRLGSTVDVKL